MKKILLSTAMFAAMSAIAYAQDATASMGGTVQTSVGTSFSGVGTSSEGTVGLNGMGGGAVVISNSGFDLTLEPAAQGGSSPDLISGELTSGDIFVANSRSVDVTGSLIGKGLVVGSGKTGTTFDASLLSNAKATSTMSVPVDAASNTLTQSYSVSGLANLSGESSSEAGFNLTGTSENFIGETGTNVGGGFDASAGYLEQASTFDYIGSSIDPEFPTFGTYSNVTVTPTTIDLAVENLGGGTVLLTGASSDLFSGATLATTDSSLTMDGDLAVSFLCSFTDTCI